MYKTKNTRKEDLKALKIKNQDEIVDLTGSKLDPVQAWEVIKSNSDDFQKSDAKAQEADALLYEMLHPESQNKKGNESGKEIIRLQENERARALELLELELLIAA